MKNIFKIYFFIERIWFRIPQKLRFLLVGGVNTLVSYILFNLLNILFAWIMPNISKLMIANFALFVQYVLCVNMSFITMRYYVFRSQGPFGKEWCKAISVYIFMWCINAPVLSLFIDVLGWEVWFAQGMYLIFSTILIFLLHKYYSFRVIS